MGTLMIQGTGGGVGKSTITTALCRILRQDGRRVSPFKPQSFSDISHITADGYEISGRVVLPAAAAKQPIDVRMNPVLVKPAVNNKHLVMILGKQYQTMTLMEYFQSTPGLMDIVYSSYELLASQNDDMIVCGMGNPAEPYLQSLDIANMSFAEKADIPVVLVADCSCGGAAAAIKGTMELLGKRGDRVCGVILNRCSREKAIQDSISKAIGLPILGSVPIVSMASTAAQPPQGDISVEVIRLPNMRNLSGIQPLEERSDVSVRYINSPGKSKSPDILIIPDCRNKTAALDFLRESGLDMLVRRLAMESKLIIGLGGGFSVMGTGQDELGLVDVHVTQQEQMIDGNIWEDVGENPSPYFYGLAYVRVSGYERRFDTVQLGPTARPATGQSGAFSAAGNVFGTYVNGLFDNEPFLDGLLLNIKAIKGLTNGNASMTPERQQDLALDALADIVRENLDMEKLYQILGE